MIETWKRVPDHDLLWASNLGRIKSDPYLQPMPNGGYRIRELLPTYGHNQRIGKSYLRKIIVFRRKTYKVASLVCKSFVGLKPSGSVVSHLDEIWFNNAASNLSWTTQKVNMNMPKIKQYQRDVCRIKMRGLPV